jgi:hypothetical protein
LALPFNATVPIGNAFFKMWDQMNFKSLKKTSKDLFLMYLEVHLSTVNPAKHFAKPNTHK